jgi:hypothetical protein
MSNRLETNSDGVIAAAPSDVQWIEAGADPKTATALRRFQMTAYTGGAMQLAGWRFPVVVDMAGMQMSAKPKVFLEHDRTARVGHIDQVQASESGLAVSGLISASGKAAQEVIADAMAGFPWQASLGARATQVEWVPEGKSAKANGREFPGPVNIARKSVLGEVSFVALGADDATTAQIAAKAAESKEQSTMETKTPPAPVPTTSETPATPATIAAAAPATQPASLPTPVEQMRAEAAAETLRIAAVRKACAGGGGKYADLEARAITEGWDAARTELEVLRASRPATPVTGVMAGGGAGGGGAPVAVIRGSDAPVTGRMLEAACFMTAKLASIEKLFDAQTLEAADRKFHGSLGLQELLLEAAWANGYTGRNFRDSRAVMQYAFAGNWGGQDVRAADSSTIDIGGILSNVANKFLLEGFFSVERTWRNICAVRNVNDFKTVTSYRLIGTDQYEQVAPGGELKHGNLGNETYTNKADTYGLLLSADRRDIINDDLGAITTVPRKLGRGSGLKINDVFWTIFLANSAFFATGNKNYLSGATTALTIDGLTVAEQTFMDQVDSDGKPIGIMPSVVLVPTALSAMGTQLNKSLEIRDTTASTKYPIANPHQGKYRTEVSRYLGNTKYTGNSTKAWYLLADPVDLPVIEVAFLNGQESPTIETAEADFNYLGIQMRGYHDFGVALQDPRGGVKSKGEA